MTVTNQRLGEVTIKFEIMADSDGDTILKEAEILDLDMITPRLEQALEKWSYTEHDDNHGGATPLISSLKKQLKKRLKRRPNRSTKGDDDD